MKLLDRCEEKMHLFLLFNKMVPSWFFRFLFRPVGQEIAAAYEDVLSRAKKADFPVVCPKIYMTRSWLAIDRRFAELNYPTTDDATKAIILVYPIIKTLLKRLNRTGYAWCSPTNWGTPSRICAISGNIIFCNGCIR